MRISTWLSVLLVIGILIESAILFLYLRSRKRTPPPKKDRDVQVPHQKASHPIDQNAHALPSAPTEQIQAPSISSGREAKISYELNSSFSPETWPSCDCGAVYDPYDVMWVFCKMCGKRVKPAE